jgi:N-acetyl-anhydromuramyl-L-alanine amidase AmpD
VEPAAEAAKGLRAAFENGMAGRHAPQALVQAGVFEHIPLEGGIFERREGVKHIVMHSTETERPADGPRVIKSWNRGIRHPGAQYVVDRDGVIYQTVDPAYGTVHVDIFRAERGVNNDNAIGIEIVRSGDQKYTKAQLDSVTRLVAYLQDRFDVPNSGIVGHGQIQPSNRTDPVNFDWNRFVTSLSALKNASQAVTLKEKSNSWLIPFFAVE